jgi:DNA-binding transcriptional LysR family regulator
MLETVTLDQLRTLVAVSEEGSFSRAARRLHRVQSAVSQSMAKLESELGVALWARDGRRSALTDDGRAVLAAARRVLREADALGRLARGIEEGREASVSLCVDAVFPASALVELCRGFGRVHPGVELRLFTEALSAVSAMVRDGACQIGVVGPAADTTGLVRHHVTTVRMVPVAAAAHPLARARGRLDGAALEAHVQVVLSERGARTPDQGVLSQRVWRVADLATKHALLRGGLGWGNMPAHLVRADLAAGRLERLSIAAWGEDQHLLALAAVHKSELSLGPAARWILDALPRLCAAAIGDKKR